MANRVSDDELPSISVCMATLNAAAVLEECLRRLGEQEYPREKIELLVGDGGSTDETGELVESNGGRVIHNPLKTGESGKAVAVREATGDLVLILDSDNFLPDPSWLRQMVAPFEDPTILVAEPIAYTWRPEGGCVERYSALLGMNDPLCHFLGNYDRHNLLTRRWTDVEHEEEDRGDYLRITLDSRGVPTIGANGTVFRRQFLQGQDLGDYLFDIDVIAREIQERGSITVAKVKNGIIHTFCEDSVGKFFRKQVRRIRDYLHHRRTGTRTYYWGIRNFGVLRFTLSCVFVLPLIFQSAVGYTRKRDSAWWLHPILCWITLWVYGSHYILDRLGLGSSGEADRSEWKQ